MASQDETPTHRPPAPGEPQNGTADSVPADSRREARADRTPGSLDASGPNEHADWDAAFHSIAGSRDTSDDTRTDGTGGERTGPAADRNQPDAPAGTVSDPAVPEAAAGGEDSGSAAGPDGTLQDQAVTAETAGGASDHRAADQAADLPVDLEKADSGASDADGSDAGKPVAEERTAQERPAQGTAGWRPARRDAGAVIVPGGHPSVAQRSDLPMRRASMLPDLRAYEPGDPNLDEDGSNSAGVRQAGEGVPDTAVTPDRDGRTAAARNESGTAGSSAAESGTAESGTAGPGAAGAAGTDGAGAAAARTAPVEADTADDAGAAAAGTDGRHAATATAQTQHSSDSTELGDSRETDATGPVIPGTAVEADEDAEEDGVSREEAERRAKEREKAAAGKPVLARVLQVMVAVFFPVVVLAAAIRTVATPLFLWAEYHRPGFPADPYGFSTDDRMTYGSYAVDYLVNLSGPRYLGDLVGDGGQPLYLATEVSHMADVKSVLTAAFIAAGVMVVLGLLALLYLGRRSPGGIRRSLFAGALVTLALMVVLVVLAVIGWEQFFTQLHTLFFANGNWTFRLDDTLIRLFPAQFWMDAGIVIAALVLLACAVVIACCWPTRARRERVRQAREDARRRYAQSLNAL